MSWNNRFWMKQLVDTEHTGLGLHCFSTHQVADKSKKWNDFSYSLSQQTAQHLILILSMTYFSSWNEQNKPLTYRCMWHGDQDALKTSTIHLSSELIPSQRVFVPSHLNKSVSRSVVGDGEAECIFGFINLHLLLDPFDVGEDEILQAYLTPEQLVHVDLVGVEGAEQDLYTHETCGRQI